MRHSQFALHSVTRRFFTDEGAELLILDDVTVAISPGSTVGIVGDNGAGKSTLLGLFAGTDRADNGTVTVHAAGGIGHLPQTLPLPHGATVSDAVDHCLRELRELEERMHALEELMSAPGREADELADVLSDYAAVSGEFEARGGYDAELRVAQSIESLGLPGLYWDRGWHTLSGGECSRVLLGATLASNPELLLLDEPTNDLDDDAVAWLESRLQRHKGTTIAVTHDREFLAALTSEILEVDAGSVRRYGDGYDGYLAGKTAERHRRQVEYHEWRIELSRSRELIEANSFILDAMPRKMEKAGFGHGAFRMRGRDHGAMSRIRNAKERVARLTAEPVAEPPAPLVFTPPLTALQAIGGEDASRDLVAHSDRLVTLRGVAEPGRLTATDLEINRGDRVLITGPNGSGKTTLLRAIAGELAPASGQVEVPGTVGILRQEGRGWDPRITLLQAYSEGRRGDEQSLADELLSQGLFRHEDLHRPMVELSYGQQRRLELARLVASPVDLLLLDEPTNHFSPALVEELEAALADYEGAVVLVTHDRGLRRRFEGRRLAFG